ncbi:hypothetical protein PIIN_00308 [Serendipita indica DSM 11827]|uniref:Uncharacterized protein n=1 Tax=Serendipita indica (strain DSM 11827) TaxID=1109443 RepID=G4T5N2_SERID|nr:hypothetical protein PIIN_00308 [Serendipita indica DSM 11827]
MFNKASLFSALVLTASFVHARPGPTWVRRQENAQSSLTLDPAVISQGLAQDGQGNTPDPGQVRSETSTNNFINHCLKFLDQGVPLTDGKQITGGSCNQTPMGRIISLDKAPRCKFVFPKNGDDSIVENTAFTVQMRMVNMVAGNFVNAQANYYAAPQQVDGNGILIGHSHIVIEPLPSLDSTEPLDPLAFKFFKGLNDPADGQGILEDRGDCWSPQRCLPHVFHQYCGQPSTCIGFKCPTWSTGRLFLLYCKRKRRAGK